MFKPAPRVLMVITFLAMLTAPPGKALASTSTSSACPAHTVCNRALGLTIAAPPGWVRLPRVPASEIDFARPHAGEGYLQLIIRAFAITSDASLRHAASLAANALIAEFPNLHGSVTRSRVTYGDAPGIVLRGLPPTPQPTVDILLAQRRGVYLIIAPGVALSTDQHKALSSLRFTARTGAFPIKPSLTVQPDNPTLGRQLRVTLTGAHPETTYALLEQPNKAGFGGGNMGRRDTNTVGAITFRYPGFTMKWEIGRWSIGAEANGHTVATTTFVVRK